MKKSNQLNLSKKTSKIKLLLLDVDGVLTDGSIIYNEAGQEVKIFNVKDGLGIKLAQSAGIRIGIITGRAAATVKKRADELDIEILYQGQQDKLEAYEEIKKQFNLTDDQIAFIGDDLNDLKLIQQVGLSFGVNDACEEIKQEVDYITAKPGGKGAVREIIELILKKQGKWQELIDSYYVP